MKRISTNIEDSRIFFIMAGKKKALSLTEILLAVVILGILTVIVTGIFTGIMVSSRKNEKLLVATALATKMREHIKLTGFADIPVPLEIDGKSFSSVDPDNNGIYFPPYPVNPALLKETVDGITYYYSLKTSSVNGTGNRLKHIIITVYWDDIEGTGKKSVSLEVFKTE